MNIRDLTYFLALIEHKNFAKAAEACFVSQPALSIQIKKLEEELNVQLFERQNKSFLITHHATLLAEKAKCILHEVQNMKILAQMLQNPFEGEIKIGVFPTLAPYLLPKIIPVLSDAFPKLTIYLLEEKTNTLIELLKQGQIDLALLSEPIEETILEKRHLFEKTFLLAVSDKNPLAQKKIFKLKHLKT